jgi:hypothetical protein
MYRISHVDLLLLMLRLTKKPNRVTIDIDFGSGFFFVDGPELKARLVEKGFCDNEVDEEKVKRFLRLSWCLDFPVFDEICVLGKYLKGKGRAWMGYLINVDGALSASKRARGYCRQLPYYLGHKAISTARN